MAPYNPSWSVIARAGIFSSFALATISAGWEAPSRKEKLVWQWSSAYMFWLIPLFVPFTCNKVMEDGHHRTVLEFNLEIVA
jgi:hypothetical protein